MADFSSLVAEVERTKGIHASAVAALQGVATRIEEAVNEAIAANDQADLSAIQNAVGELRATTDSLAAAIPAEPAPEPVPEPAPEG